MSIPLTHPQNVFKKREKVNMRYSCKAVVGHGQKCEPNYQCDACAAKQKYIPRIEKLEAALKHCINAIRQYEMGDDRPRGPAGPVGPWLLGAMDNAIKVLEGKDD